MSAKKNIYNTIVNTAETFAKAIEIEKTAQAENDFRNWWGLEDPEDFRSWWAEEEEAPKPGAALARPPEQYIPMDLLALLNAADKVGGSTQANVNALVEDVKKNGPTPVAYNIYMPRISQSVLSEENIGPEWDAVKNALQNLKTFQGMGSGQMAEQFGYAGASQKENKLSKTAEFLVRKYSVLLEGEEGPEVSQMKNLLTTHFAGTADFLRGLIKADMAVWQELMDSLEGEEKEKMMEDARKTSEILEQAANSIEAIEQGHW